VAGQDHAHDYPRQQQNRLYQPHLEPHYSGDGQGYQNYDIKPVHITLSVVQGVNRIEPGRPHCRVYPRRQADNQ